METYFVLDLGRKGFEQVILWMIARFLRAPSAPSAQLTMWKANYAMNPLSRGKEKNAK